MVNHLNSLYIPCSLHQLDRILGITGILFVSLRRERRHALRSIPRYRHIDYKSPITGVGSPIALVTSTFLRWAREILYLTLITSLQILNHLDQRYPYSDNLNRHYKGTLLRPLLVIEP